MRISKTTFITFGIFAIIGYAIICLVLCHNVGDLNYVETLKSGEQVSHANERWGQFGDALGGISNSLLTLLTLVAVLISLYYQKEEVDQAKIELAATKNSLEASAKDQQRIAQLQEKQLQALENANSIRKSESDYKFETMRIERKRIEIELIGTKIQSASRNMGMYAAIDNAIKGYTVGSNAQHQKDNAIAQITRLRSELNVYEIELSEKIAEFNILMKEIENASPNIKTKEDCQHASSTATVALPQRS